MAQINFERFENTADSRVPIKGRYRRHVIELAKAYFRTGFRQVTVNRKEWRFDVHVVDADAQSVKEFEKDHEMCHVENTFSALSIKKVKQKTAAE